MKMLSQTEKTGIHTLSVSVARSIAKEYGGNIEKDSVSKSYGLVVPEENRAACFKQIKKTMASMQDYISVLVIGCACGKMIIRISQN